GVSRRQRNLATDVDAPSARGSDWPQYADSTLQRLDHVAGQPGYSAWAAAAAAAHAPVHGGSWAGLPDGARLLVGPTHQLRLHPVVGGLWGVLLRAHWLSWLTRVGRRRVVRLGVAARHPAALYGNAPHRGGLVWYVLDVRGRSLASPVLAGLSLLKGIVCRDVRCIAVDGASWGSRP